MPLTLRATSPIPKRRPIPPLMFDADTRQRRIEKSPEGRVIIAMNKGRAGGIRISWQPCMSLEDIAGFGVPCPCKVGPGKIRFEVPKR